jgi:hypothetical protein
VHHHIVVLQIAMREDDWVVQVVHLPRNHERFLELFPRIER